MAKEIITEDKLKARNLEQILADYQIDTDKFQVQDVQLNRWEATTAEGEKLPMYQTKVRLKPNYQEVDKTLIEDMMQDLKEHHAIEYAPQRSMQFYVPKDKNYMLVIPLKDIHFGKLAWDEETGQNYDLKITKNVVEYMVNFYLEMAAPWQARLEQIVLEVGNDFFNSDNKNNTTTAGTPQAEDTRWRKTFREGRQLLVNTIEILRQVAPVKVVVIPGNHDEERSFYLGDALECWFAKDSDVTVDNIAKTRKAVQYGKNLLIFLHGDKEKKNLLVQTAAMEFRNLWAVCEHKEIIQGHFHQEACYTEGGVRIVTVGSPSPADQWHFDKGYVGIPSGQCMLYHKELGRVAQFNCVIPSELYEPTT